MDNLPIPNMRSSWVAALVNTTIAFLLYYGIIFGALLREYREHFISGSFNKSRDNLVVWVDVPRYFYPAGPATVHVHVKNESRNIFNNVKVYLVTQSDPEIPTLLIPNVFNANSYSSEVEFLVIEPLSTSVGRISFITQSNTSITSVLLKIEGKTQEQLTAIPEIRFTSSSPKALQIDFLEYILLPPWSNGFILALILLSTFLVRTDPEEKKEKKIFIDNYKINPLWLNEFFNDYIRSSFVFLVMVLMTFLIYVLLGFLDNYTILPFIGLVIFTLLIVINRSHTIIDAYLPLSSIIIFLGFTFLVVSITLVFLLPDYFVSLQGKILWLLLGFEGLIVFVWYYGRQIFFDSNHKKIKEDEKNIVSQNNTNSSIKPRKNKSKE